MSNRTILFLTTLNVWTFSDGPVTTGTAGNQTLFSTLQGYANHGYDVRVLAFANNAGNRQYSPCAGVTVYRARSLALWKALRRLKSRLSRSRRSRAVAAATSSNGCLVGVRDYPAMYIFWCLFGCVEGLHMCLRLRPCLIYGYEYASVRPAKTLGKWFNIPVISRFQGTELGFFLDNETAFWSNSYLVKGTKQQTDMVVMGNDGTSGDVVLERLGIRRDTICFWENGVTNKEALLEMRPDLGYRAELALPPDAFVVTTANRFVDWKRIDRIIRAIAHASESRPQLHLVVIGGGPEDRRLRQLAAELGLQDNVHFLGVHPHAETTRHIANADLYITLNHSGNLGNSILEALTLGVPVLTLRNGSVERVLAHDSNAILVDSPDPVTVGNAITGLLDDPERRCRLSQDARRFARDHLRSWPERMSLEVSRAELLLRGSGIQQPAAGE